MNTHQNQTATADATADATPPTITMTCAKLIAESGGDTAALVAGSETLTSGLGVTLHRTARLSFETFAGQGMLINAITKAVRDSGKKAAITHAEAHKAVNGVGIVADRNDVSRRRRCAVIAPQVLSDALDAWGTDQGPTDTSVLGLLAWCEKRQGIETGSGRGVAAATKAEADAADAKAKAARETKAADDAARIAKAKAAKGTTVAGLLTVAQIKAADDDAIAATIVALADAQSYRKAAKAKAAATKAAKAKETKAAETDAVAAAKAAADAEIAALRAQIRALTTK